MATPSAQVVLDKIRFPVRYPGVAIEIDARFVTAVRLKREKGRGRLMGYGIAPLPETSAVPTVSSPKLDHPEEIRRALDLAVERAGIKPGKASLLIPDSAARIWVLQLPEIPRGGPALLEMIRWKIKRSVPFRIEDATIVSQVISRPTGSSPATLLVGLIPRPVVTAYEGLAGSAGFKVGLVDLSSLNLFNFYRRAVGENGAATADFAFLNATESYLTLLLFRGGEIAFYRCKVQIEAEAATPEERVRTIRREIATSLSYYTEKLAGKGLARTVVRISDPALEGAEGVLDGLGLGEIELLEPSRIAVLPEGIDAKTALALTPAMGAALGRSA